MCQWSLILTNAATYNNCLILGMHPKCKLLAEAKQNETLVWKPNTENVFSIEFPYILTFFFNHFKN